MRFNLPGNCILPLLSEDPMLMEFSFVYSIGKVSYVEITATVPKCLNFLERIPSDAIDCFTIMFPLIDDDFKKFIVLFVFSCVAASCASVIEILLACSWHLAANCFTIRVE